MTDTTLLEEAAALVNAPAADDPACPWLAPFADLHGIAPLLDHTLLRAEATAAEIDATADEGLRFGTATVCVNGRWVRRVAGRLAGSGVGTAAVVGFPLGAGVTLAKVAEAKLAVEDGASELDMVLALGEAKAGEWTAVLDDIAAVVQAVRVPVKVILESAALTPLEIAAASLASARAGAAFVKTSTGFHAAGGAAVEAVRLMRRAVGLRLGVKASGGVRTVPAVLAMLRAGADRIGTSSTAAMADAIGPGAGTVGALVRAAGATAEPTGSAGY